MAKEQRFCIFCGGSGLSKEHIWSRWTHKYVPKMPFSHVRSVEVSTKNNPTVIETRKERVCQGDVNTIQLKVVCGSNCNQGWMSKLEQKAKPILIPLLLGQPAILSKSQQKTLSAWIAMKMMVCEHNEPSDVTSTADDRRHLMLQQEPPNFWRIWIGTQNGIEWRSGYHRFATTLVPLVEGKPSPGYDVSAKNTQTFTMGIGRLFIHAVACSIPNTEFSLPNEMSAKLRSVYPYNGDFLWPPLTNIAADEAETISRLMHNFAGEIQWFHSD